MQNALTQKTMALPILKITEKSLILYVMLQGNQVKKNYNSLKVVQSNNAVFSGFN